MEVEKKSFCLFAFFDGDKKKQRSRSERPRREDRPRDDREGSNADAVSLSLIGLSENVGVAELSALVKKATGSYPVKVVFFFFFAKFFLVFWFQIVCSHLGELQHEPVRRDSCVC
jgi:hypothetical protein